MICYDEKIKEQFKKVIAYSQEFNKKELNVDSLFADWAEKKERFFKLFNDNLILETKEKVRFELDEHAKTEKLNEFIEELINDEDTEFISDFLSDNFDGFYNNTVITNAYEEYNIHCGDKLIKAIKKIAKDRISTDEINQIQTAASMLIQENKVEGYLCFSIHPLDFLSLSENTYNWRSCHALDGDYRAGNLSYMGDPSTFICYLKGEDEVQLPNFPSDIKWNSKKWRVLFFADKNLDIIFAGRQYPYSSEAGLRLVLDSFKENCKENMLYGFRYENWKDDYIKVFAGVELRSKYFVHNLELYSLQDTIDDVESGNDTLHYNDLLHSSCYHYPYYVSRNFWSASSSKPKIEIGSEVLCLKCRKNLITHSELMVCDECKWGVFFNG